MEFLSFPRPIQFPSLSQIPVPFVYTINIRITKTQGSSDLERGRDLEFGNDENPSSRDNRIDAIEL